MLTRQPRSLLELSWYNFNTQSYIYNFKAIGPLVPEMKSFKGFFNEQAWWPYWSYDLDCFLSALEEALYEIFVTICPVVSEEIFKNCQV